MSTIAALFHALVHFCWQGVLLQALAWLVAPRLRSAPQRYLVLCSAQLGLVLAFVLTLASELGASAPAGGLASAPPPGAPEWLPGLMLAGVVAWGAGLLVMTARLARAFQAVHRLRQGALPLCAWQPVLEQAAARLGVRRAVSIVEAAVDSPLTLGWLKPVLLLPLGWAAQLPSQVVEAAILHELMHVRRHDYVVNVAQHLVEALFFFHPSVWWLSRQVRAQRELCCDQAVVDSQLDPLDYAAALLALERRRGLGAPAPGDELGLAAARGELSARIEHVLSRRAPARDGQRGPGAAVSALLLALAAALGACLGGEDDASDAAALAPSGAPETLAAGAATGTPDAPAPVPRWLPASVARFTAPIAAAAAAHGIDPALLALVVLLESRGEPAVESPGGAVGLMQLMPGTAASIATERGLAVPTLEQLREPALNLDLGAYYLAQQLVTAAGRPGSEQVRLAAIGYNGGARLLREHLAGRAAPYAETQRYATLLGQLWAERDADSSATYRALVEQ